MAKRQRNLQFTVERLEERLDRLEERENVNRTIKSQGFGLIRDHDIIMRKIWMICFIFSFIFCVIGGFVFYLVIDNIKLHGYYRY